ncbi:hypothetical protein BJY00DRAFT_287023 [Aspergillus carlsbadensis]|nr:hypothetical protein BJY00DRAFT_287023 [Aspergillus carlsbadensis]
MSASRIPHGRNTCGCSFVLPFTSCSSGTFACTQSRLSVSVLRFIPILQQPAHNTRTTDYCAKRD